MKERDPNWRNFFKGTAKRQAQTNAYLLELLIDEQRLNWTQSSGHGKDHDNRRGLVSIEPAAQKGPG